MAGPVAAEEDDRAVRTWHGPLSRLARPNYEMLFQSIPQAYRSDFVKAAQLHRFTARDCKNIAMLVNTIGDADVDLFVTRTMDSFATLLLSKNFSNDMIGFLGELAKIEDVYSRSYAFAAFKDLLQRADFSDAALAVFVDTVHLASGLDRDSIRYVFEGLDNLLLNPNFSFDLLTRFKEMVASIIQTTDGDATSGELSLLSKLYGNPNLSIELLASFDDTLEYILQNTTGDETQFAFWSFGALLSNPSLTVDMMAEFQQPIVDMADRASQFKGDTSYMVYSSFDLLLRNPNLTFDMLPAFDTVIDVLLKIIVPSVDFDYDSLHLAFRVFNNLLEKPGLTVDALAMLQEIFVTTMEKTGGRAADFNDALKTLKEVIDARGFSLDILPTLVHLSKNPSRYGLQYDFVVLRNLLSARHFLPEMIPAVVYIAKNATGDETVGAIAALSQPLCTRNFTKDMIGPFQEAVRYLLDNTDGEATLDSLKLLGDLLGNPNLTADMILEYPRHIKSLVEHLRNSGIWQRDINALRTPLGNPNLSPELLAAFKSTVTYIARHAGQSASYAFAALDGLCDNPNLTASMLAECRKPIVDTAKRISQVDGAYLEDYASFAFKYLLRNPNFTTDMLAPFIDAVDYIRNHTSSEERQYVFTVLSGLLENPNLTPEMIIAFEQPIIDMVRHILQNADDPVLVFNPLRGILSNPNLSSDMLPTIMTIAGITDGETTLRAFQALSLVLQLTTSTSDNVAAFVGIFDRIMLNANVSQRCNALLEFVHLVRHHVSPDFDFASMCQNYDNAARLAGELGLGDDFTRIINFAYGISEIGEEKTSALYRENGIEYFARYSKTVLEEAYSALDPSYQSDKPLLLVTFNKHDSTGVYYSVGQGLDVLLPGYKLVLSEVGTDDAFYGMLDKVHQSHGEIAALIIGGHGVPNSIILSAYSGEDSILDLSDIDKVSRYRYVFAETPTVILISCSTGQDDKAIGAYLSRTWGAVLFAPKVPSNLKSYNLATDGTISSVTFFDESSEFLKGVPTKLEDE
jgi:hypothetical protein